jgi:H+-transporting ATPase
MSDDGSSSRSKSDKRIAIDHRYQSSPTISAFKGEPGAPQRRTRSSTEIRPDFSTAINIRPQESSSDVIRGFSEPRILSTADLRYFIYLAQDKGLKEFDEEVDILTKLPSGFQFSEGLSSYEAESRLQEFGPNVLPEKTVPKWYLFLELLWQPMACLIWYVLNSDTFKCAELVLHAAVNSPQIFYYSNRAAVIIEAAIQNWIDMAILLAIQFANAGIAFYETVKAGDAVAALKASLKPKATVKRDANWKTVDACFLVPGDLILLASGAAVPADCRINDGQIDVDQAALTGESLPVTMFREDSCKMGSNIVRGEVQATVEFTGADTFFGKTANLLSDAAEFSNLQKILMAIIIVLVVLSMVLCITVFIYLVLMVPVIEALSFTVVLLVASIPLAIEIVTTTTLAVGSKDLSKHGAIVVQLSAIEDLAGMAILCSDKTGTLTLNQMEIQEATPIYCAGESQYSLLRYAAMAAKWKEPAKDALDTLILNAVDFASLDDMEMLGHMPFDPQIKRTESTLRDNATSEVFKTTKGAPHVILKLVKDQYSKTATSEDDHVASAEGSSSRVGIEESNQYKNASEEKKAPSEICLNDISDLEKAVERDILDLGARGIRSLAVATTRSPAKPARNISDMINIESDEIKGDKWRFLGMLTFLDPPRPDTKATIDSAHENGIAVKMITGDHILIARETARKLGLGERITGMEHLPILNEETKQKPENLGEDYGDLCLAADGFAQVFPEHKYLIVECFRELGYKTGMTGDGVNDAPALKRADVGIAVSGATDAARAAADIVLTQPGLSTIIDGVVTARQIFLRIQNFVTYRISASLQLLTFFFIAVFAFQPNEYEPQDTENIPGWPDSQPWPAYFKIPVILLMLITLLNDGTMITIGYDYASARDEPEVWNLPALFAVGTILGSIACVSSLLLLWVLLDSWNPNGLLQQAQIGGLSYGQVITGIFLKVSVTDFLTLFSARTGDKWFWTTPPSPILLLGGKLKIWYS